MKLKSDFILIILASLLCSAAIIQINFVLTLPAIALACYVLFKTTSHKQAFIIGSLFGAILSTILFFWMIDVVSQYAKGTVLLGFACYLASSIVLTLFFSTAFYLFSVLRFKDQRTLFVVLNSVLFSGIWCIFEFLRSEIFSALPWLSFSISITQAKLLFFIQHAAYGGFLFLTFMIILASALTAYSVFQKKWKLLFLPAGIVVFQFAGGYFLYNAFKQNPDTTKEGKVSVVLIRPGLSPEAVWDDKSANDLVRHLLALNAEATSSKAQLIVWTETTVPWTYRADDDFLNEIVSKTKTSDSYTLIGMNTSANEAGEILFNSVYLLDPKGKNIGRYDKQDLLTFVEKPILSQNGNLLLPFMGNSGLRMHTGSFEKPIETPWGLAGIMICNESTYPALAQKRTNDGATFLINIGNDNWFVKNYIIHQHFFNCRLRAVETRKDLLVNNNLGISGLIKASGELEIQSGTTSNGVLQAELSPNRISSQHFNVVLYLSFAIMMISILNKFYPGLLTKN